MNVCNYKEINALFASAQQGVWQGCHTLLQKLPQIADVHRSFLLRYPPTDCNIRGCSCLSCTNRAVTQPKYLCASAKSVGEYVLFAWLVQLGTAAPPKFLWVLRIPWEDFRGWRGYGKMPYPPTKTPTDCTDVHRLGSNNAT